MHSEAYKGERGTQYKSYQVRQHNVQVYFGDLNFRIDMGRLAIMDAIKK